MWGGGRPPSPYGLAANDWTSFAGVSVPNNTFAVVKFEVLLPQCQVLVKGQKVALTVLSSNLNLKIVYF